MGTLTLSELKSELKAGLSNRQDQDERLTRFLNFSQTRLARINDFDELQLTTSFAIDNTNSEDDRFIAIPQLRDIYSCTLLDGTSSRTIRQLTATRFEQLFPGVQYISRRPPSHYLLWKKDEIELAPMPDKAYSVYMRYTVWPTPFSDEDEDAVSDIDNADDAIIFMAIAYFYWSLGKNDEGKKYEMMAKQLMAEASIINTDKPGLDISSENAEASTRGGDYWLDPFVQRSP